MLRYLRFFDEDEWAVCQRMLQVEPLDRAIHLPRDVPVDQIRLLLAEIETGMVLRAGSEPADGLLGGITMNEKESRAGAPWPDRQDRRRSQEG